MNEDKIPIEEYMLWQEDRVTKAFTLFLKGIEEECERTRLDRNLVLDPTKHLEAAKLLGYHEAICDLLEKFTYECTTTVREETND